MTSHTAPSHTAPAANDILLAEALKNLDNIETRLAHLEGAVTKRTALAQQIESIKIDVLLARQCIVQADAQAAPAVTDAHNYGVTPQWKHGVNPIPSDTVLVEIEGQEFRFTRGNALRFGQSIVDVVGARQVLA